MGKRVNKRINQAGIDLLKKWEGFSNVAYKDVVGIWTIGYGFTKGVKEGDKITKEDAEKRLKLELIRFERVINENVHRDITDNQFSALVCFSYNVGDGAFIGSTLCRLLNQHKPIEECAKQFGRWNKAAGKEVKGLTNRRKAEVELFLRA